MNRTEILRNLMQKNNMKVADIVKYTNLPYSTVKSILENGVERASYVNVSLICQSLGITTDILEEMIQNIEDEKSIIGRNEDSEFGQKHNKMDEMQMYNKINNLLKEKNIKKTKMCLDLDISYNSLMSMFNRQSRNIALGTVQSIADYLDVTIDYLIRDEITDPNYGKELDNREGNLELIENNIVDELMENIEGIRLDTGQPGKLKDKKEALEFLGFLLGLPEEANEEINTLMEYLKFKYEKQ